MPIGPGTKLGQYEVQDFLGQGAMGLVYRAYHPQLERTGAVKVLQAISPDADTVARFRHEAQAIAQLRHPNIVNVYDFGEFQGTPYMVVEYVPGGSLAARMAQGRLELEVVLKYLRGIASGLDYAHAHGVVHRDVKPANVLLTAEDVPVLADFGLAKLLQGSSLKSMTGVTTGTPAYMAPEQVTGGKLGPPADRYSLATIAYEMLTGVIPFDGMALMELLYAQVHREPGSPSSRIASLGPRVDAVIMRGLAKDPAARWESSTAFVEALASALDMGTIGTGTKTMVLTPPVAATMPLAPAAALPVAAAVAAAPPRQAPATVAMPFPAVTPAAQAMEQAAAPTAGQTPRVPSPAAGLAPRWRRHTKRNIAIGAAVLLVLLLTLGVCSTVLAGTTLALNPSTATPGESVAVTATHVPANQSGTLQLHSTVRTYAFRADSKGDVNTYITLPQAIESGNHRVDICWNGACHKSAALRVVGGVAMNSPTPIGDQTPGSSPSAGVSPTPGATPHPSASPTSRPTSNPTSRPTSSPTSNPTSNPTSSPVPQRWITVTPTTVHILTSRDITVNGGNWPAGSKVIITFIQVGVVTTTIGNQNVQSNGGFSWTGGIPSSALPGTATIRVCAGTTCSSESIAVNT